LALGRITRYTPMWTNTWSGRIGLITHRNRFRKISGHRNLWALATIFACKTETEIQEKVA